MATTVVTIQEVYRPMMRFRLRIIIAIIGSIVGYSVAICLGAVYHNLSTAVFAGVSGVLATICLIVHWKATNTLAGGSYQLEHPGRLTVLSVVGATFGAIGVIGIVAFIAVAAYLGQGLQPHDNGYYLTSIWCFMTAKWGISMLLYCRQYRRVFFTERRPETEHLINK